MTSQDTRYSLNYVLRVDNELRSSEDITKKTNV